MVDEAKGRLLPSLSDLRFQKHFETEGRTKKRTVVVGTVAAVLADGAGGGGGDGEGQAAARCWKVAEDWRWTRTAAAANVVVGVSHATTGTAAAVPNCAVAEGQEAFHFRSPRRKAVAAPSRCRQPSSTSQQGAEVAQHWDLHTPHPLAAAAPVEKNIAAADGTAALQEEERCDGEEDIHPPDCCCCVVGTMLAAAAAADDAGSAERTECLVERTALGVRLHRLVRGWWRNDCVEAVAAAAASRGLLRRDGDEAEDAVAGSDCCACLQAAAMSTVALEGAARRRRTTRSAAESPRCCSGCCTHQATC